uniref:Putative bax-mediated apoptosis inhibitor tegt/bi-1 n=2 Tax=Culex tarsalis TaxID=7177 RepID=A0A1Q3FT62_CULTA
MSSSLYQSFREQLVQNLEPAVCQHLFHVYTCMTLTCAAAASGSIIHLSGVWSAGLLSWLLQLATCVALCLVPPRNGNRALRLGLLLATGALTGHLLGLTVEYALVVDPGIVATGLLGTTVSFACLSLSALLARRGSFLLLGAVLSNMMALLLMTVLANLLLHSWFVYRISLYLAMAAMFGFVLLDTQLIVEDFRQGNDDYVVHSLKLFFCAVDIFRLLVAMLIGKRSHSRSRTEHRD